MSRFFGNPEDRFSRDEAHRVHTQLIYMYLFQHNMSLSWTVLIVLISKVCFNHKHKPLRQTDKSK